MNRKHEKEGAGARRRRLIVFAVMAAAFVCLAVFNLASWIFLRRMGGYFRQDLKARLTSVAALGARVLEEEFFPIEGRIDDALDRERIRTALLHLQVDHELQAAYLIDQERNVILASRPELMEGFQLGYLVDDTVAIGRAWEGLPASSALHVIEGHRFLNAYAPVGLTATGSAFVLTVEASAGFFDILVTFRRGLLLGSLASLVLLLLFGVSLIWSVRKLVQAEESLRRSERLAAMGQMAATVAHEIRNPLSIIRSTADVLKRRYAKAGGGDDLLDFIPQEVDRLNRLVTDFLMLSREPSLELQEIDVVAELRKVLGMLQADESRHVHLRLANDRDSLQVRCDANALQRVLLNVLRNAVEASADGGEIEARAFETRRGSRRCACISVRDSGPGLPGDGETERIFEPFYTTKKVGTGLGLAVSRTLVEAHGGWIEARNHPEGGAEVSIYLPL